MKRQWYYRGSLKSCNYTCSYCPFSKRKGNVREQREDQAAFFRFVERINSLPGAGGAVQVVPYGEALIHSYYWEGLALLSVNPEIDAVGAQSNFSFPVEQMLAVYSSRGGSMEKLRMWGTFHPEMTGIEQFAGQCMRLSDRGISYCVGAVGVPGQIDAIWRLREILPENVYLWINKMDGLGRAYSASERQEFLKIDPYFELELAHHRADIALCAANHFVEADGTIRRCNLCKEPLGNLYENFPDKFQDDSALERGREGMLETENSYIQMYRENVEASCTRKECSCYLAYCNRREEQLIFFQPYPAFRIPVYPRAVFIDIDGTLIPEGETDIPERYVRWLARLSKCSELFLATSLPDCIARRKTERIWEFICGGVFANGGRRMIWDRRAQQGESFSSVPERKGTGQRIIQGSIAKKGEPRERKIIVDEIVQMEIEAEQLAELKQKVRQAGFSLHVYHKGRKIYKVTLTFCREKHPGLFSAEYLGKIAEELGISDSCELIAEEDCIQLVKRGNGKLAGILSICRHMGYSRMDVAVIGNSDNDVGMLEYFPFSVAVRGSSDRAQASAGIVL